MGSAVGVGGDLEEPGESEVADFADKSLLLGLLDEDIFKFEVAVDNFVAVNDVDSPEDLIEDVEGLIDGKDPGGHFALDRVEVAHIAVLHDEEVPIALCVNPNVPSKVL